MKDKQIHRMRRPSDGLVLHVGEDLVLPLARHGFHVPMTAPTGEHGYVPLERVAEAGRAGFRFGHLGKWKR